MSDLSELTETPPAPSPRPTSHKAGAGKTLRPRAPRATTRAKATARAEAVDALEPIIRHAEEAFSLDLPAPVRRQVADNLADAYTSPEPDEPNAEVSRLLAVEIAAAYAKFGLPPPAPPSRMEAHLLAEGDPVVALGPGGEGRVVLTPQELRAREEKVAGWAREIMRAPSSKANAMLNYLRASAPMDVLNPETHTYIINGIKLPLAEGMLMAKVPGRLPGRASAGPDGRPRWGCVAIAEIIADRLRSRVGERTYRRYAKNIIIHGDEGEMADRKDAAYEYGDLEVLGT